MLSDGMLSLLAQFERSIENSDNLLIPKNPNRKVRNLVSMYLCYAYIHDIF